MFEKFDHFEVYEVNSKYYSVSIEKSRIKNVSEEFERGYGVRVIKDGKLAFSSATKLDRSLVEKLQKLVKISEEKLESFPEVGKRRVRGVYDRKLEDSMEVIKETFETIEAERSCEIASGTIEIEILERRIWNDTGEVSEKGTFFAVTLEAVHGRGSAYEFEASRRADDINVGEMTERVCSLAEDDSKAKKAERKVCDVVLSPLALHQLLYFSFYPSFNAENVVKGRSILANRKGEVLIRNLTVYDDPTLEGRLFSYSFDDEGVRAERRILMEDGIVKGFLSDFKHSKIIGEKPGNAYREDFDALPKIHPSNVVIEVERGEVEGNFYVHSFIGAHTSNPVSGDFSLECMNAYQDGEPVRGAMIYGNVFEFLRKVVCMGKKVRQIENTISGEVLIEGVEIKA